MISDGLKQWLIEEEIKSREINSWKQRLRGLSDDDLKMFYKNFKEIMNEQEVKKT